LVLPATVQIDFADGTHRRLRLPVETWLQQTRYTAVLDTHLPITSVIVDPDHVLPDNDRRNNVWKSPAAAPAGN
jgi:hypothetical protein